MLKSITLPAFLLALILALPAGSETIRPENPGFPLNTIGDDFSPSVTRDAKTMVFDSRLPDEKVHNLYISEYRGGRWTKPRLFKELNSEYNDETPFITPDGQTIVFSSDRPGSVRPSRTADGNERITFDIFISHRKGTSWTRPVPVQGDVNTIYNERSPSLGPDKEYIYFTRWPYRYLKGARVMSARFRGGVFTDVKELPEPVNTGSYDMALIPSPDGEGFFLSSQREGGYGGWDLYFIPWHRGSWGNPVNLGPDINTSANEMFASLGRSRIFFSSNRFGGLGRYDIYHAPYTLTVSREYSRKIDRVERDMPDDGGEDILELTVFNRSTGNPVQARVEVGMIRGSSPVDVPYKNLEERTDRNGHLKMPLEEDLRWLRVGIDAEGYERFKDTLRVDPEGITRYHIDLVPEGRSSRAIVRRPEVDRSRERYEREPEYSKGKPEYTKRETLEEKPDGPTVTPPFTIETIYFAEDSARIDREYYPMLYKAAAFMKGNPGILVRIAGHTDLRGNREANRKLSRERAGAVARFLEKEGVDRDRLVIIAAGEKFPLKREISPYANKINRRVRIRFIEPSPGR
jgi:outer membrane protein OmpA-like peptidoglycan-associated protein